MVTDNIRQAAEQVADSKMATTAWRAFGGLAMAIMVGLSGFSLDAIYEGHAQIAAQGVQIQSLAVQVEKLSELIVTSRALRDNQMGALNDKIDTVAAQVAVDNQSIAEMRYRLAQDDVKIVSIWDDIARIRGERK